MNFERVGIGQTFHHGGYRQTDTRRSQVRWTRKAGWQQSRPPGCLEFARLRLDAR